MYLDKLILYKDNKLLREPIVFNKNGLSLVINSAPKGNSVGKTTVIHLVKYCLGGNIEDIYKSKDDEKNEFNSIQNAFDTSDYYVELHIKVEEAEFVIRRNLTKKSVCNTINGEKLSETAFKKEISKLCIGIEDINTRPSWQELKYKFLKPELNPKPIQFLPNNRNSKAKAYPIWLFLLGYDDTKVLNTYTRVKERLKNSKTSKATTLNQEVDIINEQINKLNQLKNSFVLEKYTKEKQKDLEEKRIKLENLRRNHAFLKARISHIENHIKSLKDLDTSDSDSHLLKTDIKNLYNQASVYGLNDILEDYDKVVTFYYKMISNKMITLNNMLYKYNKELLQNENDLKEAQYYEKDIYNYLNNQSLIPSYDNITLDLNTQYELLGKKTQELEIELEKSANLSQLKETEKSFLASEKKLSYNLDKFNEKYIKFSKDYIQENVYLAFENDTYLLPQINRYDGKAKSGGETKKNTVVFDIAYLAFSIDNQEIKVPHFIMIDSIENIDEADLSNIFKLADSIKGGQVIFTCLKDKLTNISDDLLKQGTILELSMDNKLLKID